MQAFIRDFVLQQPFTTIAAVGQELAVRFSDAAISNQQFCFPERHLQNQLITTKIAGKDSDVPVTAGNGVKLCSMIVTINT